MVILYHRHNKKATLFSHLLKFPHALVIFCRLCYNGIEKMTQERRRTPWHIIISTFQAMGMGKQSLILSSLRQGLVNIPLLFIMNKLFGLYGIVWTQLISDVITGVISYIVYRKSLSKLMSNTENEVKTA